MTAGNARIRLGKRGEDIACAHIERAGYVPLERNARCGRLGELDVVARHGRCLIFCEVKTRVDGTSAGPAEPLDAIGPAKQRRIRRLAAEWLRTRPSLSPPPSWIRFDAIGIVLDRQGRLISLDHVEDAF